MDPSIAADRRGRRGGWATRSRIRHRRGTNKLPPQRDSVRRDISDKDGRFALGLAKEKAGMLVGVAAEGHAAWEEASGRLNAGDSRLGSASRRASLQPPRSLYLPDAREPASRCSFFHRPRTRSEIGEKPPEPAYREGSWPRVACSAAGLIPVRIRYFPDRYRLIVEGRMAHPALATPSTCPTAVSTWGPSASTSRRRRVTRRTSLAS